MADLHPIDWPPIRLNMRRKPALVTIAIAFLSIPAALFADENQEAKTAYCKFLTEQAAAQRDLLRTPTPVLEFIQPSTGTPGQAVLGVQTSLSNRRKAKLTMDAAQAGCALYDVAADAQQHIAYALPTLERAILQHRQDLIEQALDQLEMLIAENMKLVEAHNLSRPSVYALQAAKMRLDMNLTSTFTSAYVPEMSETPLRVLLGAKEKAEIQHQIALNRLQKQDSWDIKMEAGARRQISSGSSSISPLGAYGEISFRYNFAAGAINKHLQQSQAAYGDWKKNQFDDLVQQAVTLERQIQETIRLREEQLKSLLDHDQQIRNELNSLKNVQTSAALTYKDQLLADELVLQVDIKDVRFSLEKFNQYLKDNFDEPIVSDNSAGPAK